MSNYVKKGTTSTTQRILIGIFSLLLAVPFSVISIYVVQLSINAGFTLSGVHIYTLVVLFLAYVFSSTAYTLLLKPDRHIFPPYVLLLLLALICAGLATFTASMVLGLMGKVAFHSSFSGLIKSVFIGLSGLAVFGLALVQQYMKLRHRAGEDPASAGRS